MFLTCLVLPHPTHNNLLVHVHLKIRKPLANHTSGASPASHHTAHNRSISSHQDSRHRNRKNQPTDQSNEPSHPNNNDNQQLKNRSHRPTGATSFASFCLSQSLLNSNVQTPAESRIPDLPPAHQHKPPTDQRCASPPLCPLRF